MPSNFKVSLTLLLLVLSLTHLCRADSRQLAYENIDVQMTLNKDTSIDVLETQTVRLSGEWNGLYRYYSLNGCDNIEIFGVAENGDAYSQGDISNKHGYILESQKGNINVKWRSRNVNDPPYNNKLTTFQIRYRITGAVAQYRGRDVLYWKPLMQDRKWPVYNAAVTLTLPEAIEPEMAEVVFYSQSPQAKWQMADGNKQIVFSAETIDAKDKFEIKVSLPKGLLNTYHSAANNYVYHIKPWIFPLGAGGAIVLLVLIWLMVGRDPAPQEQHISKLDVLNISPGLAGLLFDENFDVQDITATIMDLARRGFIQIKEIRRGGLLKAGSYEFELLKLPDQNDMAPFEYLIIKKLFLNRLEQGRKITTEELKDQFYTYMPDIKEAAWRQVQELGWFDILPKKAKLIFIISGLTVIVPSLALAAFNDAQVLFFAVWGSMFAGIPGFMLLTNIRRQGFSGLLKSLFFIPFVAIGLGVLIYTSLSMYKTSGWMFDVGITGIFIGVLICISAPAMARKSLRGAEVYQRLRELHHSLK
jgi:hypothetical protein